MKKSFAVFPAAIFTLLCLCNHSPGAELLRPADLRCEYLANPLGIDVDKPRLSWVCQSSQRCQKQTAYRLLVSGSRDKLDKNIGDLWDTGKVRSD
jgi:alpha-L-rhamnosidase